MGSKWVRENLSNMMRSKDLAVKETAKLIKANPEKVKLKGHVLDAHGINRWEGLTQKINRLHPETN